MKIKYRITIITTILLIIVVSCEKHEFFVEPTSSDYFDEEQGMMFMADNTSFWACKNYLCFMCSDPIKFRVSINSDNFKSAQEFRLSASSRDNCTNSDSLNYREYFHLWLNQGTIFPELQVIDLTDSFFVEEVSYRHSGDNMDGANAIPRGMYDQVISGAMEIDSIRYPDIENQIGGKLWGTFWVNLVKLNCDVDGTIISRDTVHIRKGYFKSNMGGSLYTQDDF